MTRVGLCLSGCGFLDGSEIHEAVCTLLALDQAGAEAVCCAPAGPQRDVVEHALAQAAPGERRDMLSESARIARGKIRPLADVRAGDLDAIIFPGGYGAAKSLCSFACDGPECTVHPDVERLIHEMIGAHKPIGAICIAPALLARVLGAQGLHPRITIGDDPETAKALEMLGARHVKCAVDDCVVDERLGLVTTPAYMLARGPADVMAGVGKLVREVLRLAQHD